MRSILQLVVVLAATLPVVFSAHALEPFKSYETFSATPLNPARWADGERARSIKNGQLNLMQRSWPLDSADTGTFSINFNENLSDPSAVTALKAKMTVNALEVSSCSANPAVGQSRARIIGSFFNIGSPVPESQVGDVLAQVRLIRLSNSVDAPGVLRVQGLVVACTSADCGTSSNIGSTVDLGTVNVGTAAPVQIQWDQPAKRFKFSRDAAAFSGNVAYTQTDASPPSVPFKQLSTRLDLPSCQSVARTSGMMDSSFDLISVNNSAAPWPAACSWLFLLVTELSEDDADELFPVLAPLEGRCAFEAVRKATLADIKTLRRLHDALEKTAAAKNIDGYYRANHEFHTKVQAVADNRWLDRATQ